MVKKRQKRLKALISILREENVSNQDDLLEALASKGFIIQQSTISKDLKVLGYEKHPVKGYIKTDERAFTEVEEILSRLLIYTNPSFKLTSTADKKMYLLYIYPKEPLENALSELISVFYSEYITATVVKPKYISKYGCFAGRGCVTVHLPDKSLAHKIKSELEEYASRIL